MRLVFVFGVIKRTMVLIVSSQRLNLIKKKKPKHLTWEEAGCYMLCASTAYRQLWVGRHILWKKTMLFWLGRCRWTRRNGFANCFGVRGKAIAVISDEDKRQFCLDKGAVGVINRNDFDHWGAMPDTASPEYSNFIKGARAFGKAVWDILGERKTPKLYLSTQERPHCQHLGLYVTQVEW